MEEQPARDASPEIGEKKRKVAIALASGLAGPNQASIIDSRIVDQSIVLEILREAGVNGVVEMSRVGDFIVVSLNRSAIERICMYEACGSREGDPSERALCLARCIMAKTSEIADRIERSISEAMLGGRNTGS
ncbi:MAG: hypothetical protein F7B20_06455 [Aeropyrum sp.]|nr:hypothetical protein [Aeropyrum sp.]MCE4616320.1 hypothetical protein [Aeropyrum sp.]